MINAYKRGIPGNGKPFPDGSIVVSGWGYERFILDAKTATYTPYGKDATFTRECYQCHTIVKAQDFIFTGYPQR
jgi:hypothetical protein